MAFDGALLCVDFLYLSMIWLGFICEVVKVDDFGFGCGSDGEFSTGCGKGVRVLTS